jgi:Ca2+-binding EF-hand superfamily protein
MSISPMTPVCRGREFPYSNPREAFDAVDVNKRGELEKEDVAKLMREMDSEYTDSEVDLMLQTLDLNHSGKVTFEEFKKVFIGDIRATQSM